MKRSWDVCTGRKWNTKVRPGWSASQNAASAERCELTGSSSSWMGSSAGVCSSIKADRP